MEDTYDIFMEKGYLGLWFILQASFRINEYDACLQTLFGILLPRITIFYTTWKFSCDGIDSGAWALFIHPMREEGGSDWWLVVSVPQVSFTDPYIRH